MKLTISLDYQQPQVTLLELDSTGVCAASGNPVFNPSHFDDIIDW